MNRSIAPLKPAEDAIVIYSTSMSIETVFDQVHQAAIKAGLISQYLYYVGVMNAINTVAKEP